jgi:hypothetical protein
MQLEPVLVEAQAARDRARIADRHHVMCRHRAYGRAAAAGWIDAHLHRAVAGREIGDPCVHGRQGVRVGRATG